ncbi:MAG: hypothetical protein ACYSUI_07650 [Planctomycetota bacterium]|jgi:hypothetical protein
MTTNTLIAEARRIAGCGWDDYSQGTPAERCRACADSPSYGADGDYEPHERTRLREIADQLDHGN